MAIKYEAYTRGGKKVRGVLPTDSEDDAYGMLEQDDLIPYRLKPVRARPGLVQLLPALFRPTRQDIIDFTSQLSSLLKSGIPLRWALIAQRDQTRSTGLREALRQIIVDIEAGQSFSESFARQRAIFPDFYLRLLKVGEATGNVSYTLEELAQNLQRRKSIRDRIQRSLLYPAISLAVAFVAAIVLVTFSLPTLVDLMREFGSELPVATQLMISVSDSLREYARYVVVPLIVLIVVAAIGSRTQRGKRAVDRAWLATPKVGRVITANNVFAMATTLSTLIKAGVPSVEALRLTDEAMTNSVLRARLAAVTDRVAEGTTLGAALSDQSRFPPHVAQAVVIGEMRGNLVETLDGLGDYYESMTDATISGTTELIQPAIILIIAGIVGFIAVAVISGIYATLGSVR